MNQTKDSRRKWGSGKDNHKVYKMRQRSEQCEDTIFYESTEQKIINSRKNRKISKKYLDQMSSKQNHLVVLINQCNLKKRIPIDVETRNILF